MQMITFGRQIDCDGDLAEAINQTVLALKYGALILGVGAVELTGRADRIATVSEAARVIVGRRVDDPASG